MSIVLALPSKGRLKDQADRWLASCGLSLTASGGARGYQASLAGFDLLEVRLASAADIAQGLAGGEIHLGVTGEDLLGEAATTPLRLLALGFGRADLVVAAPRSWIDVRTMADLDDVAHDILSRTGRRLRVATKYSRQTRAFFAAHGLADYRIVESAGATEGAPAASAAEIVVDITTTGATLAANGLKSLADGLILESQAQLAASPTATWSDTGRATARRLLSVLEAAARGAAAARLSWPAEMDETARAVMAGLVDDARAPGLILRERVFAASERLAAAGVSPVAVEHPTYVFLAQCEAADRLDRAVSAPKRARKRP